MQSARGGEAAAECAFIIELFKAIVHGEYTVLSTYTAASHFATAPTDSAGTDAIAGAGSTNPLLPIAAEDGTLLLPRAVLVVAGALVFAASFEVDASRILSWYLSFALAALASTLLYVYVCVVVTGRNALMTS